MTPAQPGRRRWLRAAAVTYAAELFVLAAVLLSFRIAAQLWNVDGFGAYVLARRNITLLQLALLFGLAIAIPRYTALSLAGGRTSSTPAGTWFVAGVALCVALLVPVCVALLWLGEPVGALLFGADGSATLARATVLAGAGAVLHTIAYAGYRGRLEMTTASVLQAAGQGAVPLLAFALRPGDVVAWLELTGLGWTAVALIAIGGLGRRARSEGTTRADLVPAARELARYGAPRMPGDAALAALFAAPPILVAHAHGLAAAGMVGLGVSIVRIAGSLFAPIGQILLPAATARAARDPRGLRSAIGRLALVVIAASAALAAVIVLFGGVAVRAFLGAEYAGAAPAIRWAALAMVPFSIYVVIRHVLDAIDTAAHNTVNLLVALGGFALCWLASRHALASFDLAVLVLGVLTARDAHRLLARLPAVMPEPAPATIPEAAP